MKKGINNMLISRRGIIEILKEWNAGDPFTYSAAIAYYALFSFPALIIILIKISSLFLDGGILEAEIDRYLSRIVGASGAEELGQTIEQSELSEHSGLMLFLGIALLVFASLRLFVQMQKALNHIWGVNPYEDAPFLSLLRQRLLSFAVMLAIGFTLLVSLLFTSLLSVFEEALLPYTASEMILFFQTLHIALSFATITLLFTLMLKLLPDTIVRWRSALQGGAVSAALFLAGEYALNLYFEAFTPQSAYGVAGSFILLMLWVSYSSMILFLGAQVSRAHQHYHSR